ncbi:MAG: N-acetylglucosamine kinase [Rhodoglobus sp.]
MIVGIDIGGTKTHIVVEDGGLAVYDHTVRSDTWQRGGLLDDEGNIGRLLALLDPVRGASSATLAIGAHGLDSSWQTQEFATRVDARHGGRVRTVNDVELLGPAAGFDEAIAVVVGTGSKIVAHSTEGTLISAGGYGYLVSDAGSAPALAREAIRAILQAHDDGTPADALNRAFMNHYDVDDVDALAYAFTTHSRLTDWGALAPLVFSAADSGSTLAATVIDDAARDLANGVRQVHLRGAIGRDVVCAGGVISNQPRLYRAVTRHINDFTLGLTVHLLQVPPVVGAVEIARKLHHTAHFIDSRRNL